MRKLISAFLGAVALLAAGSSHSASVGFGSGAGNLNILTSGENINIDLFLDLTGVTTSGGGFELIFSGGASFVSFTPSAYFNTFDTDPNSSGDFSGFGDPPGGSPFELYLAAFNPTGGGNNSLGTLQIQMQTPGSIQMVASPGTRWGEFIDANGAPIPNFGYSTLTGTAVPLPAAAWLFATGMGFVGWRHSRKRS